MDHVTIEEKNKYEKLFASFIYRTCIPFSIADSNSFRDFIGEIRPGYRSLIPTGRVLAGRLLNEKYSEMKLEIAKKIEDAKCFFYGLRWLE